MDGDGNPVPGAVCVQDPFRMLINSILNVAHVHYGPEAAGRRKKTGRHLPMEEMSMYQKKAFNRREQDYAMGLRRKLEEAEAMLQHLAPSRARSLALTKLDEALLWANVGIAEAGLQQGYTAVPRNRGFDFDNALATNVDGQQVRATRAGDITFDGMKIVPRMDENHAVTAQNAAPSAEGDLVLLKPGQVAIDAGKLAKLVEESAQKEAAMGKDGASPPPLPASAAAPWRSPALSG